MRIGLFLGILISLTLLHAAYAQVHMGSLLILVKPEKNYFESNDIPVLVGNVTDQGNKPIANASVSVSTSYGTSQIITDQDGNFKYQYPSSLAPAQYLVNIKAQKDTYGIGLASTTFFVKGTQAQQSQQYSSNTVSGDKINQDPIASRILKNIELAKKQQAEQDDRMKKIQEEQQFVQKQRDLANQQLQIDLGNWFQQLNPFTPRNAYAAFVSQINQTIQIIFWGQFNFTEQKTNQGLSAKDQVLQNGGSNDEARNAFIQNATTHRDEISKVNNDLNVRYGHADNNTQSKFDKYGNIPRS